MKLLLPLLATSAFASSHLFAKRSATLFDLIKSDLAKIMSLTEVATNATLAFNGNLSLAIPITTAGNTLVSTLQNMTMVLEANTDTLTNDESTNLGAYTQILAYSVNASIAALISKKPFFSKSGLDSTVVTSLQTQKNASANFSDAITAKIPEDTRPVAVLLSSGTTKSIQQGIDCFSGMNQTCNPNAVNGTRTLDAAQDSGAIAKGAGVSTRAMDAAGYVLLSAAVLVGVVFAA